MPALLTKNRPVSEVRDSPAYNQRPLRRAAMARGGRDWVAPVDTARELLRVLIVDGNRPTADTLSLMVRIWGHDVRRTYDGVIGLALAATFRPDVLLLDMALPKISGFEVVRQVRQQDRLQHCFIIAVTGRTDKKHRCQCYKAGVDLLLTKPVAISNMQTLLMLESQHALLRRNGNLQYAAMLNQ